MLSPGLYIVATPIGNRDDISLRAQQVLSCVNLIAAEDTRHSRILLESLGIKTPLIALHEHNERETAQSILTRIQEGQTVALISDAGTPLLSDPGYFLVRQAQEQKIAVIPIPGACAAITALSAAGMPTDRFCFEGFLPAKSSSRQKYLSNLVHETRTLVFYESPHRIVAALTDMKTIFGDQREVAIGRELTKKFETIYRAPLATIVEWIQADPYQQKGEFVVIVHGAVMEENNTQNEQEIKHVLNILSAELSLAQAVKLTAAITGLKKNAIYDIALQNQP